MSTPHCASPGPMAATTETNNLKPWGGGGGGVGGVTSVEAVLDARGGKTRKKGIQKKLSKSGVSGEREKGIKNAKMVSKSLSEF